jgi:Uma2 family endonuclease
LQRKGTRSATRRLVALSGRERRFIADTNHCLGIAEYWIVDYLAIGSRNYLGNPKVPTVFVYHLDANGVYQSSAYKDSDRIVSPTFPEVELTVDQILSV